MDQLLPQPYSMVALGLLSASAVGIFLLFYHFVYPKKKLGYLPMLILISLIPLVSVFRNGSYESGDLSLHVKYAMGFFDNITQGNLIPQWMGNDCTTYGCPEYIFIFFLPYYLISLLHFIGLSFLASVKALLIVSFIASGIGMYYWMRDELGEKAGFVAALFYLFTPYHLIDLHFRVSIGEMVALAILPFLFWFTKRYIEKEKKMYFLLFSLMLSLLILAHNATAFLSFPLLFLYGGYVWMHTHPRKKSVAVKLVCSVLLGVSLSAFYLLPLVSLSQYIWYSKDNQIGFHPWNYLLYSPYRFFLLFQGRYGELYTSIGYTQLFVVVLSVYLLLKGKIKSKEKYLLTGLLFLFLFLFYFMLDISKPVWDNFSFLKSIQFSWRLMVQMSLITSVIAAIVVTKVKMRYFFIALCVVTVMYTALNWGNRKSLSEVNDTILRGQVVYPEKKGFVELTTPHWVDREADWIGVMPKRPVDVLSGSASITPLERSITSHSYKIVVAKDAVVKENTYYFPGWELYVDNVRKPINFQNKDYKGVITFPLEKGVHTVVLQYVSSSASIVGQKISAVSLIIFLFLLFFPEKKVKRNKKKSKQAQ